MQCVNLPCRLITFYQFYLRITIVYHEILQILPLVILLAMLPSN